MNHQSVKPLASFTKPTTPQTAAWSSPTARPTSARVNTCTCTSTSRERWICSLISSSA